MIKFSLGYNQDTKFLELIDIFNEYIFEIYFPAPVSLMGSGRALTQNKNYPEEIKKLISICNKHSIESNILLNATCEGKNTGQKKQSDKIIEYLKKLSYLGLTSVTITNPIYVRIIKSKIPSLKIHSSVNCYVKNVEHAKYLKYLGVDVITIDRDINRDLKLIKEIKKNTKSKIKLLLNEGCLRNCPFRHMHFNMISHQNDTNYFDEESCRKIYEKYPEKVFSIPFIRPEDLNHYEFGDYFKLATRTTPTIKIPLIIKAYYEKKFDGNLLSLLSTKGLFYKFESIDNKMLTKENFFGNLSQCDNQCDKCNYCKKLLKKAAVLR